MRSLFITTALALLATQVAQAGDISAVDLNGDGMLSSEEFAAAYPDAVPDLFVAVDLDGDGLIDADEFSAATASGGVLAS